MRTNSVQGGEHIEKTRRRRRRKKPKPKPEVLEFVAEEFDSTAVEPIEEEDER